MSKCGWSEEMIIDLHLGKISSISKEQFLLHRKACTSCSDLYDYWEEALAARPEIPNASKARKMIKGKFLILHLLSFAWLKKYPFIALPIVVLMLGLVYGIRWNPDTSGTSIPNQAISRDDSTIMMSPHTVEYEVVPVYQPDIKGFVWKNDNTQEMLLIVEGIIPMSDTDYQVWFAQANHRFQGGLLTWDNGIARYYIKGIDIRKIDLISVSIEPKGGSKVPTGPEAMYVNFR